MDGQRREAILQKGESPTVSPIPVEFTRLDGFLLKVVPARNCLPRHAMLF